jgi:hypothetical protein
MAVPIRLKCGRRKVDAAETLIGRRMRLIPDAATEF